MLHCLVWSIEGNVGKEDLDEGKIRWVGSKNSLVINIYVNECVCVCGARTCAITAGAFCLWLCLSLCEK